MAAPDWPAALPQAPFRGQWNEQPQDNVARFKPEVGPSIQRRRSTAPGSLVSATFRMTAAQYAVLETFYATTLKSGALRFRLAHPRTGVVMQWTFEEAYSDRHVDVDVWDISMTLRRVG